MSHSPCFDVSNRELSLGLVDSIYSNTGIYVVSTEGDCSKICLILALLHDAEYDLSLVLF